uniref:DUF1768 domain-containing protein n=1 Tax=Parastrongyloides trichosuri TaxID=131310 RepID=A0A0N4ZGL5_PARTI
MRIISYSIDDPTYRVFSNSFYNNITIRASDFGHTEFINGATQIILPTAEHCFALIKANHIKCLPMFINVLSSDTFQKAKKVSNVFNSFEPTNEINEWNDYKFLETMIIIYCLKCRQTPEFKNKLYGTRGYCLVQTTGDLFWSCGLRNIPDEVDEETPYRGKNVAGYILMKIRNILFNFEILILKSSNKEAPFIYSKVDQIFSSNGGFRHILE